MRLLVFLTTFMSIQALAQNEVAPGNIVDMYGLSAPSYTGGYFSPGAKATTFVDQNAMLYGARGGLVFNEALLVGAFGFRSFSEVVFEDTISGDEPKGQEFGLARGETYTDERAFSISYGGAYVGWVLFPRNLFSLTVLNS